MSESKIDFGTTPVHTPATPEQREMLRTAISAAELREVTSVTEIGDITLNPPSGTFSAGDMALFHIQSTGGGNLSLGAGIVVPSDSAVIFPKALTAGKTYIVQLVYVNGGWGLATLVGGY
jgi:hypothetical protein